MEEVGKKLILSHSASLSTVISVLQGVCALLPVSSTPTDQDFCSCLSCPLATWIQSTRAGRH